MNWKHWDLLKEIANTLLVAIIVFLILGVFYFTFTNISDERKLARETENSFCAEGRTYEGLFEVKSYCKGKQFTCETEKCYWVEK